MEAIWQSVLNIIREEAGSRVVETWFNAVSLVRWDALKKVVYLKAPNKFVQDWVYTHYKQLLKKHLSRLFNEQTVEVIFINQDADAVASALVPNKAVQPCVFKPAVPLAKKKTPRAVKRKGRMRGLINESYIFDTFVVGPNNELAFAAANAVAGKHGSLYNPLFIYGGSGLGKTHLLHAIGNRILKKNSKISIVYQSADRFVNQFINAIRFDKMFQFESQYKGIDVLLIDDIQFISRKEQTQEAFFHIFNSLHQAGKQIVITSDSMPRDIDGLAQRIRSRLEGGLVVDIHEPMLETMVAIVRKKAETYDEALPDDVAYYIASHVYANVRELEGALIRVMAFASLTGKPLTLELAQKVLSKDAQSQEKEVDKGSILKVLAKLCDLTVHDLCSSGRAKKLVQARHIAMYLLKNHTVMSYRDISRLLKRKDHSTVMYGCEKIEKLKESDSYIAHIIGQVRKELSL